MKPESPVIRGHNFPETIIAKDQPEYLPLPVIVTGAENKTILSRWTMEESEKSTVSRTGKLYINLLHFGHDVPSVTFQIENPIPQSETELFPTVNSYAGENLPIIHSDSNEIWLELTLTEYDRQILAEKGDVYFFMVTNGQSITPSMISVESPLNPF